VRTTGLGVLDVKSTTGVTWAATLPANDTNSREVAESKTGAREDFMASRG
jgi:hypothetical protein